jgi:hypothetical protein
MMKNTSGIIVNDWGTKMVKGIDQIGNPFAAPALQYQSTGDAFFHIHGEDWLRKDFLTFEEKLPVFKYMDLSTGHITKATSEFLQKHAQSTDPSPVIVYEKANYGFMIVVDGNKRNVPKDLKKILALAIQNDCYFIMLDRDGTIIQSLPFYEW